MLPQARRDARRVDTGTVPSAEVSSPKCPREVSSRRMASGPTRGPPPGWCDLPELPGQSDLGSKQLRALLGGAGGVEVAKSIQEAMRAAAVQEGDVTSIIRLLEDDEVCDGVIAALDPDMSQLADTAVRAQDR